MSPPGAPASTWRRLRTLQVVHGWPPERSGGTELYASSLVRELAAYGGASGFCATGDPRAPEVLDLDGVRRVRVLPSDAHTWRETWERKGVEGIFADWLVRREPEIVHFHHLAWLSTGLPALAARAGALVVMTLHDYWACCPRGQLFDSRETVCAGPGAWKCARCLGDQLGLAPWNAPLSVLTSGLPVDLRRWLRALAAMPAKSGENGAPSARAVREVERRWHHVRQALASVDVLLSPSDDLARRMRRLLLPDRPVRVLPLPLLASSSPREPAGEGPVRFIYVGALLASKGVDLLVDAFARLPQGAATLDLVGPAPQLEPDPGFGLRLARRCAGLPGVRTRSALPHPKVAACLAAADVLVVPSRWFENSPMVVREARAMGLRVLAARTGGIPEVEPDCAWFRPGDVEDLLSALQREVRLGRLFSPPRRFPTPEEHAEVLVDCYRAWRTERRGAREGSPSLG